MLLRKHFLEDLIRNIGSHNHKTTKLALKVCGGSKYHRYYVRDTSKDNSSYQYMPVSRRNEVQMIAQQEYEQAIIAAAKAELSQIDAFQEQSSFTKVEDVYDGLCEGRKQLVEPILLPDDLFIKQWSERQFEKPSYYAAPAEFVTQRGEAVRSKSELIIANVLANHDIPYFYEAPLVIFGRTYNPDFLVLNKRTRREYYWEHLGMMGNSDYASNAVRKLLDYQRAGYYPGEQIILTSETYQNPLSTQLVNKTIEHYLL